MSEDLGGEGKRRIGKKRGGGGGRMRERQDRTIRGPYKMGREREGEGELGRAGGEILEGEKK